MSKLASAHLGQHVGEVAVVELGRARRVAREVAEVLGDARVAVAGDQLAVGPEALGDGGGVAAGAEGGVEGDLTGGRLQKVDQLLEQDGGVGECHLVLTELQARLR